MPRHCGSFCRAFVALTCLYPALFPASVRALSSKTPTNSSVLPLVVTGARLPQLLGESPHKLSAFTCDGQKVRPVLFQVDDVNADGRVLSAASEKLAPDEKPGVIDETDELVVMLADLGSACGAEQLSRVQGRLVTIRVSADYLKEPAWFYVLAGERGFVPGGGYVQYEAAAHTVKAQGYTWGYVPDNPVRYDRMRYADLRGRGDEDLFDRLKVRFNTRALASALRLLITEEDMTSKLVSMRVGPVRAVREVDVLISKIPGLPVTAHVTFAHYARLWRARIRFRMPVAAAATVSSMDFILLHDFIDLRGLTFSTSAIPQGTHIDGRMIGAERAPEFGAEPWYMLSGNGLNQVTAVELDPTLELTATAVLIDSREESDPPEDVVGGLPSVGYQFLGMEGLEARWYGFGANIAALPGFPEGGGTGFYRTLHAPLEITTGSR